MLNDSMWCVMKTAVDAFVLSNLDCVCVCGIMRLEWWEELPLRTWPFVLMHSMCYLLVFYQFDHCIVTIKWKRIDKRLEMNTDIRRSIIWVIFKFKQEEEKPAHPEITPHDRLLPIADDRIWNHSEMNSLL